VSDKLTEVQLKRLREMLAKSGPASRAAIRRQLDALAEADRNGTHAEFVKLLRGKCAKCDQPPVVHVTDVGSGTGEVTTVDLCEEHAHETATG
jgi:hypothetical protein